MNQQNKIDELKDTMTRIINDDMYCILDEDDSRYLAENLIEAGYRKASDVAREMIDEVKECFAQMTEEVENAMVEASQQENKTLYTTTKYGRDVLLLARHTLLKTLKKKYESEGEG